MKSTLPAKARENLRRAGIRSFDEFVEIVKTRGLEKLGDGTFFIVGGPYLRNSGKMTWAFYLDILTNAGLNYHDFVLGDNSKPGMPISSLGYRLQINSKIEKLILLLDNFKQFNSEEKPLNTIWPVNTIDF